MANMYRSYLGSGSSGIRPTGDAQPADVLAGKTFSNAEGIDKTGTMTNNGAISETINLGETYTIPVKADATFDGANKLKAAVYPTGVDANSAYILKGGKFCLVTNASVVPAGKAYLLSNDVPSASAPELSFIFGSETTGINDVKRETITNNGEVYNLNGQRVAQPSKGLYIVNGRKVVVK